MSKKIKFEVLSSGYLWEKGRKLTDPEWYATYARLLSMAAKGEDPGEYDNSPFHSVDSKLAGKTVTVIADNVLTIWEITSAFLPDGTRVKVTTDYPLSFKRWDKEMP